MDNTSGSSDNKENGGEECKLGVDEISLILAFLSWKEILQARVSKKWQEAAKLTMVPDTKHCFLGGQFYHGVYASSNQDWANALGWLSVALPRLDGLAFRGTVSLPPDVSTVQQRFPELRHLTLSGTNLSGFHPSIFQFRNLISLDLRRNNEMEWDLESLSGLPNLQKLQANSNLSMTGNLQSLTVLKNTLVSLSVEICPNMYECYWRYREIGSNDFVSISELFLGDGIYGNVFFDRIDDVPGIMKAKYNLMKRPTIFDEHDFDDELHLREDSLQFYHAPEGNPPYPPFWVEFVYAGRRSGWKFTNCTTGGDCETEWFEPAPLVTDEGYDKYVKESIRVHKNVTLFRGFTEPPTHEEYLGLCRDAGDPFGRSIPLRYY
ncbi:hypothetical protein FRACYDRAFT_235028 [Fragilariopsis cylindrus CCMP1102]|uniref:L domain-like protein n=1 Tax=Fragilariopsis cylindrus CCMP1102 TaxID=635003 RepID=A0A1E7FTI1_9STRA|nr:hypothetical protein FRACYDRAFT_235028 [Fragilariopsis cylindrus CCMP1102]|eukprot:OEU21405.1 hypothetical protein FRACYDRAFT_235028 [Fragilariopsis cylindrus CCMP1102]